MRLDLADLRLFLAVVEAGSITQGAVRVHLALPSASERLRHMEHAVGTALLERRPRGVVSTEAGEALAHHARRMLAQHEAMHAELRDLVTAHTGTLRLYANTAALTGFLPERIAPWLAQRPRLQLDIRERSSIETVEAVRQGVVEAGVVADSVDAADLQLTAVADDRLVLIASRSLAMPDARTLAFGAVLHLPFVGLAVGSALQAHIDQHAEQLGHRLNYRMRVPDFAALCTLVAHGVGVALVPQHVAKRQRALRQWALRDAWCLRRLCLCQRVQGVSAPMQSLMVHLLAAP